MSSFVKSGTKQWVFQRVSNLLIILYSLLMAVLFCTIPLNDFDAVHTLLGQTWFKALSSVCIITFSINSVIAGWQIAGDYVQGTLLNKLFNTLCVVLSLTALVITLFILWR